MTQPRNAMTVDVEDYFQVSAFERYISRDSWDDQECRVERNVDRILELFDRHGVKATFFTLGWIAQRYPEMVRRMIAQGHELASHGWSHVRVTQQDQDAFRQDVVRTKSFLEDLSGQEIIGYRAASYSIGAANLWALDVLGRNRPPLQFQYLPDQARSLWHAGRATFCVSAYRWGFSRVPRDHFACR